MKEMKRLDTSLMNPAQQEHCEKFITEPDSKIGPYIICTAPEDFGCDRCGFYDPDDPGWWCQILAERTAEA